jgi:hypothetical protein
MSSISNIGAAPVALITPQAPTAPAAQAQAVASVASATPADTSSGQALVPLLDGQSYLAAAIARVSPHFVTAREGVGSFRDGSTTDITGTDDTPEGALFGGNDQTINVSGTYANVTTNGNRNHISVAASGSVERFDAAGGDHETVDIVGHVHQLTKGGGINDPGGSLVNISGSVDSFGAVLNNSSFNVSGHVDKFTIFGSGDVVNITGTADAIKVTGDNNKIEVPVGFKGKINLEGKNDQIIIVDADGKPINTDTVNGSSATSQTRTKDAVVQNNQAAEKTDARALSQQDVAAELALDVIIKAQAAYEQSVKTKPGTPKSDNPENYAIANALAPSSNDRKTNTDSASKTDAASATGLPTQV